MARGRNWGQPPIEWGGGGGGGGGFAPSPGYGGRGAGTRPPGAVPSAGRPRNFKFTVPKFPPRAIPKRTWAPSGGFKKSLGAKGRVLYKLGEGLLGDIWPVTKPGGPELPYDMTGFRLICRSAIPNYNHVRFSAFDPNLNCPIGFQIPSTWLANQYPHVDTDTGSGVAMPPGIRWVGYGLSNIGAARMTITEQWVRDLPTPAARPQINPIGAWRPYPAAMLAPYPQNAAPPEPVLGQIEFAREEVEMEAMPQTQTQLEPGGNIKVPPDNRPPPPGEWERKILVLLGGSPGKLYGFITEIGDAMDCLINAIHAGMPQVIEGGVKVPKPRPAGTTPQAKAAFIVNNKRFIDFEVFARCMVTENFKDAVIGKANQYANRITKNPYWVRPVGVGAGGWASRNAASFTRL